MEPQQSPIRQRPAIPNMPPALQVAHGENPIALPPIPADPRYSAAHASQYDKGTLIALIGIPVLGIIPGLIAAGIYFVVKGMNESKKNYTISGIAMIVSAVLLTAAYVGISMWLHSLEVRQTNSSR